MKPFMLLTALLIAGCGSVAPMTEEARRVREINVDNGTTCDLIGVFEAEWVGIDWPSDMQTKNLVRNATAANGGDSFAIVALHNTPLVLTIQYEAFDCGSTYSAISKSSPQAVSPSDSTYSRNRAPVQQKDEYVQYGDSNKMIRESDCIGPVVAGKCTGSTIGGDFDNKTCHGSVLHGECIGVEF